MIKQVIYIGTATEEFVTSDKVIREELTEPKIFEKWRKHFEENYWLSEERAKEVKCVFKSVLDFYFNHD